MEQEIIEIQRHCPDCNAPMEKGFLGPIGFLLWFKKKKRVFSVLEIVFGRKIASTGYPHNQPAFRCQSCGLVIFKGRKQK